MKTQKSYASVSELVGDIVEEKELRDKIRSEIRKQSVATVLFSMRCNFQVTQQQMAKRVERSQSWISKLEHASTDRITVEDLERYSRALEVNLVITFQKPMNAVESVKYHFFQIKKHLDGLLELAEDDEDIRAGVNKFHDEWLVNALKLFLEGKVKLAETAKPRQTEALTVVGPEDPPDDKELADLTHLESSIL